jgi:hypothetical protein
MALLQALLAFVFRSLGRIVNTAFGWATTLLFGKVPAKRQIYLSMTTFGSVVWLFVTLGIAFPRFAAFMLAFVTLPEWFNDNWLRLVMAVAAVVIPPIVGALSIVMVDPVDRPKTRRARVLRVLKGYPYTFGLAVTIICMLIVAPLMHLRAFFKRWKTHHVPMIVELDDYLEVVNDVQEALKQGGVQTRRRRATWLLRAPTKLLTIFAGDEFHKVMADNLTVLVADCCEVLLHPSDLVIRGRELQAARLHATLTERLTFTKAYLTWDKEANKLEDRLRRLFLGIMKAKEKPGFDPKSVEELRSIEQALRNLQVSYEEWEVLFREKLQVERCLLRAAAGVDDDRETRGLAELARRAA